MNWNRVELVLIWILAGVFFLGIIFLITWAINTEAIEGDIVATCEARECPAGMNARLAARNECVCLFIPKPAR